MLRKSSVGVPGTRAKTREEMGGGAVREGHPRRTTEGERGSKSGFPNRCGGTETREAAKIARTGCEMTWWPEGK